MSLNIDETRPQLRGFTDFYDTELRQWLAERSGRHGKAKTFALIAGGVGLALLPLWVWLYILADVRLHEFSGELAFAIPLLYVVGVVYGASVPLRRLHGEVKAHLLGRVCNYMGLSYSEKPQNFPFDSFKGAGLLPSYNTCKLEDHIRGVHDTVKFQLAECVLKRRQRTGKTTSYVEVYHGILVALTFTKQFNGKLLVRRDAGAIGNFFGGLGKEQRIRLEDPRFEKMFEVYGTDQVEARYLLTPTFMERIVDLTALFGKKAVELAFTDNRLLVSIRVSTDQFEGGGLFTKMTDTARIETLVKELCAVFDVVDTLQLNLRTRA